MTTLNTLQRAARYRRVRCEISTEAAAILNEMAEDEKRTAPQQASYLLENLLLNLPSDPDARVTYYVRKFVDGSPLPADAFPNADTDNDDA